MSYIDPFADNNDDSNSRGATNAAPIDLASFQNEVQSASTDLSSFDDDFMDVEFESNYDDVPDGKYQVLVDHVELKNTKYGDPMLTWHLTVLGSEYDGRKLWRNSVFKSKDNLRFFKKDLHICGLELYRLSELPQRMNELVGLRLLITKKTTGKYSNIYFNKRLEAPAQPTGDVPF